MSLTEIKHAVRELSPQEFAELRKFIADQDHSTWTERMDDDAAAGKLEFLFDEADREGAKGQLHNWPEKQ